MNNPNIQTYQITFSDGEKCALKFDLSSDLPVITVSTQNLNQKYNEEYLRWVKEDILPDILDRLTPIQLEFFRLMGEIQTAFKMLKI